MMEYFSYDGFSSMDFATYLVSSNLFDAPEKDVQRVQVPGRNGDILIPNDRYSNFAGTAIVFIEKDIRRRSRDLKEFLYTRRGYCKYIESYQPDQYRMAAYQGPFTMSGHNFDKGYLTLTFDCKPQIYLTSGDIASRYTTDAVIVNPTLFESQPLIRAYGSGLFSVNGYAVRIAPNQYSYIDLDCERMDAYNGQNNCNPFVSFSSDFPRLSAGENNIVFGGGITALEITPRWWTI